MLDDLRYFRRMPQIAETNRALNNSLQTFEGSLLDLAFRRYPQALIHCTTATENLLRATIGEPKNSQMGWETVLDRVCSEQGRVSECRVRVDFDRAMRARQDFIREGCYPQDNPQSVEFYMGAALPFYIECWKELYSFDLLGSLFPNIRKHIEMAQAAFATAGTMATLKNNRTFSISALAHYLQWNEMMNLAPEGALGDLTATSNSGMDRVADVVRGLENNMNATWTVACPVCGAVYSLVVDLDYDKFLQGEIACEKALCGNCGYQIPASWAFMGDLLCAESFELDKAEIIKKYAE